MLESLSPPGISLLSNILICKLNKRTILLAKWGFFTFFVNWIWFINGHFNFIWNGLFYGIWYFFNHFDGLWHRHIFMNWIWFINYKLKNRTYFIDSIGLDFFESKTYLSQGMAARNEVNISSVKKN